MTLLDCDFDEILDQFLNVDSTSVSEDFDVGPVLVKLLNERKYYEMLTVLPSMNKLVLASPNTRLILALMLFHLGRVHGGLRQLCIAIEIQPDLFERERLLNYLLRCFNCLKLNGDIIRREIREVRELRPILHSIEHHYEKLTDEPRVVEILSVEQQTSRFLEAGGILPEESLGRITLQNHKQVQRFNECLMSWKSNKSPIDPLKILIQCITAFCPLEIYQLDHKLVKSYIDWEISKYPEIDLTMTIKGLIKCLKGVCKTPNTFASIVNTVIKMKLALGFLAFLTEDYQDSSTYFIWLITFISTVQRKFPSYIDKTEYLTIQNKRTCCIFLTRCIEHGDILFEEDIFNLLASKLVNDDIITSVEFSNNRLSSFFISCGYVLERLSNSKAKVLDLDDITVKRWDKCLIGEMLRKYVLASTFTPSDDPLIIEIIDRVIWGLLLYGGIHLQTLWFFQNLRNYFLIENEFKPIFIHPQHNYHLLKRPHVYKNLQRILNEMYELSFQLTDVEKEDIWDLNNKEMFLIPTAFTCNDKIYLMDHFYDETFLCYKSENFSLDQSHISVKLKSTCKFSHKILNEQYDFSKSLIDLWVSNYTKFHSSLPFVAEGVL
ncbi:hypothetical protein CLIB1444_02S16226 [[Candida] jaroonii]|uniref:Uncharacterized protein n=1 Tax=[Candida] jaroonii TaxID=467808 RepID=A0ACA9Y4C8_9ASCO|nr:hypothetical protein CLIB1444_02S16226 [[Candida] jaroonii]